MNKNISFKFKSNKIKKYIKAPRSLIDLHPLKQKNKIPSSFYMGLDKSMINKDLVIKLNLDYPIEVSNSGEWRNAVLKTLNKNSIIFGFSKSIKLDFMMELRNKVVFSKELISVKKNIFGHQYQVEHNLYLEVGQKFKFIDEIQHSFFSNKDNKFQVFDTEEIKLITNE